MNVICRKADYDGDSIMMAFNDTAPIPLPKNTANYKVRYNVIPTQPDLIGLTIPVGPGAYYLTTKGMAPFMAYNYGDRGIDPDRDIGDNDDDDFFFSYASPSGCAMPQSPPQFDVTVDTLCAQWHICVRTTNPGGAKISAVELLNDPTGDIYRPARVSRSVRFDPILDAANTGQVTFDGADSVVCFDIEVRNPWDTAGAVAYLLIHDVDGGSKLVDLHYKSPQLHSWVVPNWPNQRDSIIFPGVALQGDTCAKVYFYNKPVADANDIQIDAITVKHKDGHFAITNLSRPLPTRLHSGDTIAVSVCFAPKDQYLPNNSFTFHIDTLLLTTECFSAPITLVGSVGASAIYATDKDFGDVSLGLTTCDTVTIRNVGSLPLVLTDTSIGESLSHNHNFYWNPSSSYNKNRLPVILQPGQFIRASFCFSPTTTGPDSARVEWVTAQGGARKDSIKSYSILRGTGIKSGVEWDRRKDNWYLDSLQLPLQADHRVFLVNRETAVTYVDSVVIHGSDAAEFSIIENELGLTPLTRFPVEPGDSIYVVFRWMPDITTTYPARYRDRHAQLVAAFQTVDASGPSTDSTVMELNGTFDIQYKDAVRGGPAQKSDAVVYLLGTKLVFHLPGGALKLSQVGLYDFLGRRLSEDLSLVREGDNSYSASIGDLASGMYVVRYAIDGTMHSTVLMK